MALVPVLRYRGSNKRKLSNLADLGNVSGSTLACKAGDPVSNPEPGENFLSLN